MAFDNHWEKYVGSIVNSKQYGEGIVCTIEENDENVNIEIVFESSNVSKVFNANIAFEKNLIFLIDESENDSFVMLLQKHRANNNLIFKTANCEEFKNETTCRLIKKIIANKEIAIDLIPLFDDGEYEEELFTETFPILEKFIDNKSINETQKAGVILALSYIALKSYDGDLFGHFEEKYRDYRIETQENYSRSQLQNAIYGAMKEYREKVKYFTPNSYVAVPVILSCVPHRYVGNLFKLAYDIYKKNYCLMKK